MRYFVNMRHAWHRSDKKPIECTKDYARALYREAASGPGIAQLRGMENMATGYRATGIHFVVWGEEVTDKEIFQRILKGELQSGKQGL